MDSSDLNVRCQRTFYSLATCNICKGLPDKDLCLENKSEITDNMPEISQQHVEQLAQIASVLRGLADSFDAQNVVVSHEIAASVEKYVASGTCLRCEQKKSGRYTRGQCASCYNDTRADISGGRSLESDWIKKGRLTPVAQAGGRKPAADRPSLQQLTPLGSGRSQAAKENAAALLAAAEESGGKPTKKRAKN